MIDDIPAFGEALDQISRGLAVILDDEKFHASMVLHLLEKVPAVREEMTNGTFRPLISVGFLTGSTELKEVAMKLLTAMGLLRSCLPPVAPMRRRSCEWSMNRSPMPPADQATRTLANAGNGTVAEQEIVAIKGVIHPPPTHDPSVATPPGNSAGKVIPPPGTPGGDENVQPK